jgi:hypothetical protein
MIKELNTKKFGLEELSNKELISTFAGDGFAHDAGCAIRYGWNFTKGFMLGGGNTNLGVAAGKAYAEVKSGAC